MSSNIMSSNHLEDTLGIMTAASLASRNPSRNVSRQVSRNNSFEGNDTLGIMTTASSLATSRNLSRNISRQVSRSPSLDDNDTLGIMTTASLVSRNVSRQVSRCPSFENKLPPIRDALQDVLDATIFTATVSTYLTTSKNSPTLNHDENTTSLCATTVVGSSLISPKHPQERVEPRPWMSTNRSSPSCSSHAKRQIDDVNDDYGNPDDDYMIEELEDSHYKDELRPSPTSRSPGLPMHRQDALIHTPRPHIY